MSDRWEGALITLIASFVILYGWTTGTIAIRNSSVSREDHPGLFGAAMALAGMLWLVGVFLALH